MGRHQCKNSFNNLKSKIVTPESSGHTIGRLDHHNTEGAEENYFKCNIMKMMETFKEVMKNSSKEMDEKTNQKLEESNKSLKETPQKTKKTQSYR